MGKHVFVIKRESRIIFVVDYEPDILFAEKSSRLQGDPATADVGLQEEDRARVREHGRQQQGHRPVHRQEGRHSAAPALWHQGFLRRGRFEVRAALRVPVG